jgi:hypothetical protein
MPDWQSLGIEGLGPVSRRAAEFQVGPPLDRLPFASFRVKVIERGDGSFLGVPNVAIRGPDGSPDWTAGLGGSVEEALEDALRWFVRSLGDRAEFAVDESIWSEPEDF